MDDIVFVTCDYSDDLHELNEEGLMCKNPKFYDVEEDLPDAD